MKNTKKQPISDQGRRFTEAARELGCDEDETKFNVALGKVARHKPPESGALPTQTKSAKKRPGEKP